MKIAVGDSRMCKKWDNQDISWDKYCEKASVTIRTSETVEEYRKLKKETQDSIKDVGGFVGGHLIDGCRKKGKVQCRSLITLDIDYGKPNTWDEIKEHQNFKCCVYSTHKHTPEAPRLRLVIKPSREMTEEEYPAVARMVAKDIGIELFDDSTYEASRLMYWPSTSKDGVFFFDRKDGPELDPDAYLARYENWKDISSWPASSRRTEAIQKSLANQVDPLTKGGFIGPFCRAYGIENAIDTFLSNVYEPSTVSGRYSYIPAESSAGLVIYDGKFAYSFHATDPAYGRLMNAFDLVRVHRFGSLDENSPPNTPMVDLPSFKAMLDLARADKNVKALLGKKQKTPKTPKPTDKGWEAGLEYDGNGKIKNTLRNLILILNNDPMLKSLVFNELLDGIEIKGDVPWKHPSKFWRDADDAQLISYVDSKYGTFSARNYEIAITKVTDDRSYHPIRAFFEELPKWDGVERVDTLLIDYLGASDNAYVRAVTRKTLCAAISRVLHPGCKFDSMLVLNGPQGIGKSTLIAKLAGEWFSDSLNLGDTKDKTAAEKLQGYWILEIGELAGLKKTEVETLRSFLSRQNDIYRASFGRRATPHLRQCVFFGTTNAESGYLRDTTGNRRFWPVKTPGGAAKHSWELTGEEIQQIWAEARVYVDRGEKLYLDIDMETLAKTEQREAMESDEREGLVREYLDTLLPADWDDMGILERRLYLNDAKKHTGTIKRTCVCNMEIWCECFGKDRSDLRYPESRELTSILARLGWKQAAKKKRIPPYGAQYYFEPMDCSE